MGPRNKETPETDRIVLELFASCYERDNGTVWKERADAVRRLLADRDRVVEALRDTKQTLMALGHCNAEEKKLRVEYRDRAVRAEEALRQIRWLHHDDSKTYQQLFFEAARIAEGIIGAAAVPEEEA